MRTFQYVRVEPKSRPDITASFVLKIYKHKNKWYYRSYYSKRQTESTWFHGTSATGIRFDKHEWQNGIITWMEPIEVLDFFL